MATTRTITGRRLQRANRDTIVAGAGICSICSGLFGLASHGGATTVDHSIPLALGGPEFGANRQPAHGSGKPCPTCSAACGRAVNCNQIRGKGTVEQARERIEKMAREHQQWCSHAPAVPAQQTVRSPGRAWL